MFLCIKLTNHFSSFVLSALFIFCFILPCNSFLLFFSLQESQIKRIYGTMISQKLQEFEEEVKPIGGILTQATLELYHANTARFLPTPTKMHYLFNLRDISKALNIMCHVGLSLI